ncbi:MAG: DUF421 domain-containing protein [Clostridiales bacterium]|jgi:uncharacterized membrane protein YcaP (DUF421 family)|nr:DUF421 domain-containing protein [Clostridiales bacterium]
MQEWLIVLLRAIGLYILVFAFIRIIGKKHPAKTTPFSFVNYTVIAVITALLILGIFPNLAIGSLALSVWVALPILGDFLATRSKAIHDVLHGRETVLIKQGKIMEENLQQVRLTGEELLADLRQKNVFNLADVEFAMLETTGELTVLLKSDKKPITPYDLQWDVAPQTEPQTVVLDGNILHDPLTEMGLTHNWLNIQLETAGLSLDNIFIGQVDSNGELYFDLFDDSVQMPQANVRELLYANLEKAQADFMKYSYETQDSEAKSIYYRNAERLDSLIKKLQPYLLR